MKEIDTGNMTFIIYISLDLFCFHAHKTVTRLLQLLHWYKALNKETDARLVFMARMCEVW